MKTGVIRSAPSPRGSRIAAAGKHFRSRRHYAGLHSPCLTSPFERSTATGGCKNLSVPESKGVAVAGLGAAILCRYRGTFMRFWLCAILLSLAASHAADWLTFGGDPQRTGWARRETKISRENVKSLALAWKLQL